MSLGFYQIDAFTDQPFGGNPAAVVWLEEGVSLSYDLMLKIAQEMNLSETAFLQTKAEGTNEGNEYHLRWFTPAYEVDLCGHATFASAHFLKESKRWTGDQPVTFLTRSGALIASWKDDQYQVDFPIDIPEVVDESTRAAVVATLHDHAPDYDQKVIQVSKGKDDFLVVYEDEACVLNAQPNLREVAKLDARAVVVTACVQGKQEVAAGVGEVDFISRLFGPAAGIDEDPATGSSHCMMAPYWQSVLHQSAFKAYQASPRGGKLRLVVDGDRVLINGDAVTTLKGEILTSPDA